MRDDRRLNGGKFLKSLCSLTQVYVQAQLFVNCALIFKLAPRGPYGRAGSSYEYPAKRNFDNIIKLEQLTFIAFAGIVPSVGTHSAKFEISSDHF